MNKMEQIQNFIKGLKRQTCMLLDAYVGGTIKTVIGPQVKDLIEKMCFNEYLSNSERSVKIETIGMPKSMLAIILILHF